MPDEKKPNEVILQVGRAALRLLGDNAITALLILALIGMLTYVLHTGLQGIKDELHNIRGVNGLILREQSMTNRILLLPQEKRKEIYDQQRRDNAR